MSKKHSTGKFLAALGAAITSAVTAERTQDAIVAELAEASGISAETMNSVIKGEIQNPPKKEIEAWAGVLGVEAKQLLAAAKEDGNPLQDDPEPEPAPTSASKVVPFNAAASEDRALAYAGEVNELCMLAGHPEMAAELIRKKTPIAQVSKQLLEARASTDDVSTQHHAQAETDHGWGAAMASVGIPLKQ